ncbi:MAG TPA: DUF998 domain-containing protein [Xanthobacteraceae bacterium]|jgi:hypothetical membrane protein|nr:DUF998 domain-containing protein [Xanthobacteraceae bacterium]
MKKAQWGAIFWMLCVQYFAGEAISIAGWRGPYSISENYISDLGAVRCGGAAAGLNGQTGAICSPLHAAMNTSFVLQGLLIVAGTLCVWPIFPSGRLWAAALLLTAVSGLGVFVVGLAPEDTMASIHYLGAVENLFCTNATMVVMGVAMLGWRRETRLMGALTLGAGLIGIFGFAFLAVHDYFGLGVGGMERVTAYPFPVWIAAMGALLFRRGGLVSGMPAKRPKLVS